MDSLLIKPAGPDCNLVCGYCFYRSRAALYPAEAPRLMPRPVLAETIRQYAAIGGGTCSFCWQGGEPTLAGLDFFRGAMEWMARFGVPGQVMANSIQTNGILLDDAWGSFLARGRFFVGLSLDGPAAVHDGWRRDAGGAGTFARVARAAKLLERHGVPFNVLAVVTPESAAAPEALYDFFLEAGFRHLQFIPVAPAAPGSVEPVGVSTSGETPGVVSTRAYGEFLCRLFDRWSADDPPAASVRTFEGLIALASGLQGAECVFQPRCARYVVVEHNGDVYACDFLVEPAWKLGNLMETPLWTLFQGPVWRAFGELKPALPEACRTCEWLDWCGGGCPAHRRVAGATPGGTFGSAAGVGGQPHFCASYRAFFVHAGKRLRELAARESPSPGEGGAIPGNRV